jgi:hypothetical protein
MDGAVKALDPPVASSVMLIDASAEKCIDAGAQEAWKAAARNVSDLTAAYLGAVELEEIWKRVASSPCYRVASAETKMWADLFAAIAGRNSSDIVKLGTTLIGSPTPITEEDLAYLATITAAAYIHMNQIEPARVLLQEQSKRLNRSESYWFPLANLMAFTQSNAQRGQSLGGAN